ncbi:CpaF family protein [Phytoactinopolyspora halotolerans]|uniref:Type II/IV secretion system ATPase subunit n=1 Tax=Phytoactinopolyspora halotolerans TaxID=1981512 RepID=A0A6L9S7N3_9ACTN|nr:CpaF/VirB11 family protein [Phytoactinopolyspora halotolerans]NEE01176.1 type II/IV secretion system ATPase subunit [Phytoactinopolyspora halotolerans]
MRRFQDEVSERLARVDGVGSEERRRRVGREIISEVLREHLDDAYQDKRALGQPGVTPESEPAYADAVFNAVFGLGRLQPLIDDTTLENIEVYGAEKVEVVDHRGRRRTLPPIADTEDELVAMLARLAARGGAGERTFTEATPTLHLTLAGGHRLAATGWVTGQTVCTIRRHRLIDLGLDDLLEYDTFPREVAEFLAAAVRAKRSIVVTGNMDTGKTTLVRALANEIPPGEKLITIETEYELHLDKLPDRHHRVIAFQYRPGSGELGPDGRQLGEYTLERAGYDALRHNGDRVIVGEVRGPEILQMFEAMQAGSGTLSTIHANSARAAIERMVTCAIKVGGHIQEWAYRQIAEHIDLIVHLDKRDITADDGRRRRQRQVCEVVAITPGEDRHPAVTDVFRRAPSGEVIVGHMPDWVADLAEHGYSPPVPRGGAL